MYSICLLDWHSYVWSAHLHLLQSLQFGHQILDLSIFLRQHWLEPLQLCRISSGTLQLHQGCYLDLHITHIHVFIRVSDTKQFMLRVHVLVQFPFTTHSTFMRCSCCLLKACCFCSDWYWTFIEMSCLSISARLSSSCKHKHNTPTFHL